MATMSSNVVIRPAERSDIPAISNVVNAAYGPSVLHQRMAPGQHRYPTDYYYWRMNITRQRFATSDLRTIVAEDTTTGQILGVASWAAEGSDSALYKRWVGESSWFNWLEDQLIWAEKMWARYVTDRSVDYRFLDKFMAAAMGADHPARPACLHPHQIIVDPNTQSKGVGRMLVDWGKDLSVKEEMPLFLEANLEAVGFYERVGFLRLKKDFVVGLEGQEPIAMPVYAWEGKEMEGRWLERDPEFKGEGERWRWKSDVLPK